MADTVNTKNIFTKDTPVPFYALVAAAMIFLSVGYFVNDQGARLNKQTEQITEYRSEYRDEVASLKKDINAIRDTTSKTVNDINKQLLYIQIIVSKIATKNNIDIKTGLPTALTLPEALSYEPE